MKSVQHQIYAEMIPRPEMITKMNHKWSWTENDTQIVAHKWSHRKKK